jgi:hypothetical protein
MSASQSYTKHQYVKIIMKLIKSINPDHPSEVYCRNWDDIGQYYINFKTLEISGFSSYSGQLESFITIDVSGNNDFLPDDSYDLEYLYREISNNTDVSIKMIRQSFKLNNDELQRILLGTFFDTKERAYHQLIYHFKNKLNISQDIIHTFPNYKLLMDMFKWKYQLDDLNNVLQKLLNDLTINLSGTEAKTNYDSVVLNIDKTLLPDIYIEGPFGFRDNHEYDLLIPLSIPNKITDQEALTISNNNLNNTYYINEAQAWIPTSTI